MISYNSWGVIKMSQNVSAYKNIPIKMFIKMHLAITKPLQILNSSLNSTYVTHAHRDILSIIEICAIRIHLFTQDDINYFK